MATEGDDQAAVVPATLAPLSLVVFPGGRDRPLRRLRAVFLASVSRPGGVMLIGEPFWEALTIADDRGDALLVLKALDRLLRLSHRRSRLLGLDEPERFAREGKVRCEVIGVDLSRLA